MVEPIRILTLWDPWATLAAFGLKGNETRPWGTKWRGLLAIHASKRLTWDDAHRVVESPFAEALASVGANDPDAWPRGAVIAIAELTAVERILRVGPDERPVTCDVRRGYHPHGPRDVVTVGSVPLTDERELAFGLYCTGRWSWKLERVRRTWPVSVRGQQGLRVWAPVEPIEWLEVGAC